MSLSLSVCCFCCCCCCCYCKYMYISFFVHCCRAHESPEVYILSICVEHAVVHRLAVSVNEFWKNVLFKFPLFLLLLESTEPNNSFLCISGSLFIDWNILRIFGFKLNKVDKLTEHRKRCKKTRKREIKFDRIQFNAFKFKCNRIKIVRFTDCRSAEV